jgi:tetratricopeptide (TPR) repeat protein
MPEPLQKIITLWETQHIDPPGNASSAASMMTSPLPAVRAWAALTTAAYELRFGDLQRAEELLETARDHLVDPHTADEQRCLWLTDASWGYLLLRRGQLAAALKHISALQLVSNPAIMSADWCMLHTTLHFIYKRQGNFETSLRQIYSALELVERHELRMLDPIVRLNLAAMFIGVEDWVSAAEQLARADKLAAGMANHALTQRIRINRAITAQQIGDLPSAQTLTRECLTYSGLDEGSLTELWINAVNVSLALKDQNAAELALDKAVSCARQLGQARHTAGVTQAQGRVHAAAGRYGPAEKSLREALGLAQSDDELRLAMQPAILRTLAEVQALAGDHKAAYATLTLHQEAYNEFMAYRLKNTKLTLAAHAEIRRLTSERDQARKLQQLSESHAAQLQQKLQEIEHLRRQVGDDVIAK